jgi:uncharacterized protein (TIGR03067 family)
MIKRLTAVPLAIALVSGGQARHEVRQKAHDLAGSWIVVSVAWIGPIDEQPMLGQTWTFDATTLTMIAESEKYVLAWKADSTKDPKRLELKGPEKDAPWRKCLYSLARDELRVIWTHRLVDPRVAQKQMENTRPKHIHPDYGLVVILKRHDPKAKLMEARPKVHVYPRKLVKGDTLTDGKDGRVIPIEADTTLVWVDHEPELQFWHRTEYLLISNKETKAERGLWWPVLNGKNLFRD